MAYSIGENLFFFWRGVLSGLPALRSCVSHKVITGTDTLFWKDYWMMGNAPRYLWPSEFRASSCPNGTIHDLIHLLEEPPFSDIDVVGPAMAGGLPRASKERDKKWWRLTGNGLFFVKSFYRMLIDGGLRCPVSRFFWRDWCPKKVSLFNWLAWQNKILSLENLARRRCNRFPTDTCVLCHEGSESADHLFIHCSVAKQVWEYFFRLLNLPHLPSSLRDL